MDWFNSIKNSENVLKFMQSPTLKRPPQPISENIKPCHVVIIGTGLAGSACASQLVSSTKDLPVTMTLIDVRATNILKYAGCRAAALGEKFAYRACIPNTRLVPPEKGRVINKKVVEIDPDRKIVILEDQSEVKYDILVCASGARNVSPCEPPLNLRTIKEQVAYYESIATEIRKADHVTVLGSGAVGTELAGEIKSEYPGKVVVILSPGEKLVDGCVKPPPDRFFNKIVKSAEKLGLELYLEQRPINISLADFNGKSYLAGNRTIKTDGTKSFVTDLILLCTGKLLNNKFYPDGWLDNLGHIRVLETLQIPRHKDIFAIGDINDVNETKQGYFAQKQGKLVAKNIVSIVKEMPILRPYKPVSITQIIVPLGRDIGVSYLGGVVFGNTFTSQLKGKDLFVKDHWSLYRIRNLLINENSADWERQVQNNWPSLMNQAMTNIEAKPAREEVISYNAYMERGETGKLSSNQFDADKFPSIPDLEQDNEKPPFLAIGKLPPSGYSSPPASKNRRKKKTSLNNNGSPVSVNNGGGSPGVFSIGGDPQNETVKKSRKKKKKRKTGPDDDGW